MVPAVRVDTWIVPTICEDSWVVSTIGGTLGGAPFLGGHRVVPVIWVDTCVVLAIYYTLVVLAICKETWTVSVNWDD